MFGLFLLFLLFLIVFLINSILVSGCIFVLVILIIRSSRCDFVQFVDLLQLFDRLLVDGLSIDDNSDVERDDHLACDRFVLERLEILIIRPSLDFHHEGFQLHRAITDYLFGVDERLLDLQGVADCETNRWKSHIVCCRFWIFLSCFHGVLENFLYDAKSLARANLVMTNFILRKSLNLFTVKVDVNLTYLRMLVCKASLRQAGDHLFVRSDCWLLSFLEITAFVVVVFALTAIALMLILIWSLIFVIGLTWLMRLRLIIVTCSFLRISIIVSFWGQVILQLVSSVVAHCFEILSVAASNFRFYFLISNFSFHATRTFS